MEGVDGLDGSIELLLEFVDSLIDILDMNTDVDDLVFSFLFEGSEKVFVRADYRDRDRLQAI